MSKLTVSILAEEADREAPFVEDARQSALTREFLWPMRQSLEVDLLQLRAEFDRDFLARNPSLVQRYPIGYCREICVGVMGLLQKRIQTPVTPGITAVRRFVAAGGFVKRVWGDLRHCYFQNAMQMGGLYVDVANDSVVRSKPKVEILPLAEADFFPIHDYGAYARLAETYWCTRVVPNVYFPQLAPLYPLLLVYPGGAIRLHAPYQTLFFQNLLQQHHLAEAVIFSSSWSANRLSDSELDRLEDLVARLAERAAFEFHSTPLEQNELRSIFNQARMSDLRLDGERCDQLIKQNLCFNKPDVGAVVWG